MLWIAIAVGLVVAAGLVVLVVRRRQRRVEPMTWVPPSVAPRPPARQASGDDGPFGSQPLD